MGMAPVNPKFDVQTAKKCDCTYFIEHVIYRGARSRRKTVGFSKIQKSNMLCKIEFFYIKSGLGFKILRPLFT